MSTAVGKLEATEYIGYAAADKEEDSQILKVYVPGFLPFVSGELKAMEVNNQVSTKGTTPYQGKVKTTNIIEAKYRGETSNRAFPPDIRKGEEVIVFNYADDNTWYWRSSARNDNARRTETYRVEVSGTLENTGKVDDDNTYFFELDTRRTHSIRISTSNKDGEQFRYTFKIDADNNSVFLGDDGGNQFYIKSDQPRVCMKNTSNSMVDLNDKNIVIMAENDISIVSTKGNLTFSAQQGTSTHYAKKTMKHQTDADMQLISEKDMSLTTNANYNRTVAENSTTNITKDESITTQGAYTRTVTKAMTTSTEDSYTLSATKTITQSSTEDSTYSSGKSMTVSGGTTTTISSGATMTLSAGGGLSMTFNGSGVCDSSGSEMTMKFSKLSIQQG